jgi:hypothetical protein
MKIIIVFIVMSVCYLIPHFVAAQTFREIFPMRSTCSEVTKFLNVDGCKKHFEIYSVKNARIEVEYSSEVCETAYKKKWNIQPWTVVSAIVHFRQKIILGDFVKVFGIDINTCEKTASVERNIISNDLASTIYSCKQEGVSFWSYNDYLSSMVLTPSPKEDELICKSNSKKNTSSKTSVRKKARKKSS